MSARRVAYLALVTGVLFSIGVPAAEGDPEAGRRNTSTCNACHGQASMVSVPNLGGQGAAYFVAAMQAYQDGRRAHPTMREVANSYSDRQLKNLAAYYAQFGATEEGAESMPAPAPAAACETCHRSGGRAPATPVTPVLAGQKTGFLNIALREYRDGVRKHADMQTQAAALSDADIEALAAYYAGRKRLVVK
jgi:cytochrome c553